MLFGTALRGQVNVSRARQNREASSLSRHTHGSTQLTCEHVNEMYKQVKLSIEVPQDGCKADMRIATIRANVTARVRRDTWKGLQNRKNHFICISTTTWSAIEVSYCEQVVKFICKRKKHRHSIRSYPCAMYALGQRHTIHTHICAGHQPGCRAICD